MLFIVLCKNNNRKSKGYLQRVNALVNKTENCLRKSFQNLNPNKFYLFRLRLVIRSRHGLLDK